MPDSSGREDPDRLLVGTTNLHKVEEIATALRALRIPGRGEVRVEGAGTLASLGPVEETAETFEDNAREKAAAWAARAGRLPAGERPRWVLADDSGLAVDALGGAPGVRSARYAGEGAGDASNRERLLEALREAGKPQREVAVVSGECRGLILESERGSGGFGYDSLFWFPPFGKTFAELGQDEKNSASHRGKALALLRTRLEEAFVES
jgi:XTP/dITP diphosphohydrolase